LRESGLMDIAIVGSGHVGHALGKEWHRAGHAVTFAMRNPASEKAGHLRAEGFAAVPLAKAASVADLILLAVPWLELATVIEAIGPLDGKIVVDATNPLTADLDLAIGFDDSAGETVALLAKGARVVKAFNTTGAENMAKAGSFPTRPLMPIAGDDADAKAIVRELAEALGFEAIDAGPLTMSRHLEAMAMLWIKLAYAQGLGTQFAFALTRR
jgi:predicted dinucleotide-binding enzyme